jgi:hypothetical protein
LLAAQQICQNIPRRYIFDGGWSGGYNDMFVLACITLSKHDGRLQQIEESGIQSPVTRFRIPPVVRHQPSFERGSTVRVNHEKT